jgi:tetratricopeptide (TPR) repeat protein
MMGQYEPALQAFTRALERERSAENLGNVLAALLKLGELEEAADILTAVRERFPPQIRDRVFSMVARDPDLASLRPTSGQPTA